MARKDYYEALGISETASPKEIKKAYRGLAKEHHPDTHPDDKVAEERFKEISEAYDTLSDPKKREEYDRLRKLGASGFPGAGGFDMGDIFRGRGGGGRSVDFGLGGLGDLFGHFFDRGERSRRERYGPRRGQDIRAEVEIPFEQGIAGGRTRITVQREETCPTCSGSGARPGAQVETCPECRGSGTVSLGQGGFAISRPCPRCYGRGTLISDPCPSCSGTGAANTPRTLEVNIPEGVEDGSKVRLRGQGGAGVSGGSPGDLIVTMRVTSHKFFERKGTNIHCEVPVDLVQAALGTKLRVRTVHENQAVLTIPPGTQTGTTFRLTGMGLQANGTVGDQFVKVVVHTPTDLTPKQRELLEAFAAELDKSGQPIT